LIHISILGHKELGGEIEDQLETMKEQEEKEKLHKEKIKIK
jgi:hypothetical protein